ncbi:Gfo/Idh/MocA family oxidoreductase [Bradyrhizobium diazoefficiens]|uniref:Putative oxidoreductase n=1 Tax=Bradyrhizobium diazoefficiens SEMIA 5080 TaxID=754504 RepID=A0A837CFF1_9BRAD|nr:Gfo/Idh/MocA family oxidoreductase [Bradyrhizobium diazoefficiens]APO55790.1 oxidoreductase [Bradyrhizobium diazoefficiens]KGJ67718.1 putative oxidoreductase [Bradyrhizobium diazoefficiens SEMIA 5080]KOY07749.1 oxidoreductase [Bradyrhizobium diazoefficiens]MCD9293581.1 Gfo/Idh/MocA family oxidoreductase [Bradyrhizobium diazoefficiens]MCD9808583.1 Gfo/Idh/MocA family oxidoreductase [Bradyrhizobium diazoefficiens]
MKNITIGVIGAGLIGRKHLAKLAGRGDYDLVGIADVNSDRVAADYPGTPVFADYRKLLDEARPEAVIIASPNQLHAEQGIACARRGIHILIEKPVTDTVETAASLIAEVRKAGVQSLVGHHRRHHQQVRTLKAVLGERRIGDVVGVSAIWATHKPAAYFEIAPWRSQAGGGPILINLIHEIDFLRFTVGEIVAVEAIASNRQRSFAVEDTAAALIEFDSGALGTFFISDSAVSPWTSEQGLGEAPEFPFSGESSYRFLGRAGSIEFPALVQWSQAGGAQDWNKPIQAQRIHASSIDPYVAQLDHFRDIIRANVRSLQPVEDGARSLIATLAVAEAAVGGRRVDLRHRYETLASPFVPATPDQQRVS